MAPGGIYENIPAIKPPRPLTIEELTGGENYDPSHLKWTYEQAQKNIRIPTAAYPPGENTPYMWPAPEGLPLLTSEGWTEHRKTEAFLKHRDKPSSRDEGFVPNFFNISSKEFSEAARELNVQWKPKSETKREHYNPFDSTINLQTDRLLEESTYEAIGEKGNLVLAKMTIMYCSQVLT